MKFNRLYIAVFILAAAVFSGCEEYVDTVVPGESFDDDYAVRFLSSNPTDWELDPNGDLTVTLTVIRDNKGTAIEVPLTEAADTADVFTVPSTLSFAAGEDTVSLVVTMDPSAPKGVVYGLEIEVAEAFYESPYKIETPSYSAEVAISVWSILGTVQFYDYFCFSSDVIDVVTEVTLEQNGDDNNIYRISYPYTTELLTAVGWDADWGWGEGSIGGTTQNKIVFTVNADETVSWGSYYTNLLYNAASGNEITAIELAEPTDASVVVKDGNEILYFQLNAYYYIDAFGAGFGEFPVYLGMPGYDLANALGVSVFDSTK